MSGEQFDLAKSIEPFFGFDKRALHFFNSNYFSSNYESCVNSEAHPESLFGTRAQYVMRAENYNPVKGYDPKDNDVHFQYTDFVVKTALFHREIDRSSLMGSGMIKFKKSFEAAIDDALGQSIRDVVRDTRQNNLLNNKGLVLFNNRREVGDVSFANLGLASNSDFFDLIVANLFMIAKQHGDSSIFGPNFADTQIVIDRNDRRNTAVVGGAERREAGSENLLSYFISGLVGNCDSIGGFGLPRPDLAQGNYCLASYFSDRTPGRKTEAAEAIRAIAEKVDHANADRIIDQTLGRVSNAFVECTLDLARQLFTVVDFAAANAAFAAHANSPAGNLGPIRNIFQDALQTVKSNGTLNQYKKCLADITLAEVKKMMTPVARGVHTDVTANEWTKQIIENVFSAWDKLDSKARVFYGKHLHIFAPPTSVANEDVDLMPDGKFMSLGFARGAARLNLMKDRGIGDVLFGETLPWLPVDGEHKIENVWYTATDGKIKSFKAEKDSIRRLYRDIYLNGSFVVKGATLQLPATYEEALTLYENKDFDINDLHIIHNVIKEKAPHDEKNGYTSSYDEMLEDLTTREVYKRDKDGLYKLVNGEKVRPSLSENNCAGTGLNSKDNKACIRVVSKCLIDGDKDSLAACLDEMKHHNLFDIAHDELENMNPDVAIKILEIFGVGGRQLGGIYVVESLDEWIERAVRKWKPEVRNSIINNQQLKDYIAGVIDFVNSHPAIMNEGMVEADASVVIEENLHDEDKRMKKELFRRPRPNSNNAKLFEGKGLYRYANHLEALPPMLTGMTTADVYSNTLRGQVVSGLGFVMSGGNRKVWEDTLEKRHATKDLDSDLLWGLFNSVMTDLKNAGLPLKKEDEDTLRQGLDKLREQEIKLGKLYTMLRTLADLLEFFKNSCCETLVLPKNISINQIKSRQDTIAFLTSAVCDMEDCIAKNAKSQNNVCNNMIKHFGTLFESLGSA